MTLVDTQAAAHAARVKPATIRSWARRGKLAQHGTDWRGRSLYDLAEVYTAARDTRPGRPATTKGTASPSDVVGARSKKVAH